MTKNVHCEITGKPASIDDAVALTKINAVIAFKNFDNAEIDENEKTIYSPIRSPLKYYSEIPVPNDLRPVVGRLFSCVDDEDDLEQSTAIISQEGIRLYTGHQLIPFLEHINQYELIKIPDTMFVSVVDRNSSLQTKICENWNMPFKSVSKKYRFKRVIDEKREKQTFGYLGVLLPGYDVAITDCSQKNPNGIGYLFKTEKSFQLINLCSNESAVDYCIKNKCLVYYNDFLNKGNLRLLSAYTEDINTRLQNSYKFRSSNI